MFVRRMIGGVALCALSFGVALAQAAPSTSAKSEFEVATVRPAQTNDGRNWWGMRVSAYGRFEASAVPLTALVHFAYIGNEEKPGAAAQVGGGPGWAKSDTFDITAKADDAEVATWSGLSDAERRERVRPMLRTLLEQRFRLKVHAETSMKPAYALVQVKGGAKLAEVPAPPANEDPAAEQERLRHLNLADKPPPGHFQIGRSWQGSAVKIGVLASSIQANANLDAPLVDETGLGGYYDFDFTDLRDKDAPPLLDQIEQKLGLKVIQKKEPITTYVIDSAEKPTAN